MSDLEEMERTILAGARRALSPTAVDGARVRVAALTALSSGAVVGGMDDAVHGVRHGSERLADWVDAARDGLSASKVVVAALALAGAGGAGYALGFSAGREAQPAVPMPGPTRQPTVETAFVLQVEQPSVSDSATPIKSRPVPSVAQPKAAMPAAVRDAGVAVGSDDELRTLRRVETLLRENNPRFALALLDQLDKTIVNGKLREERDAARVVARCALESASSARNRARDFAKTHPASVYLPRVDEACSKTEPE